VFNDKGVDGFKWRELYATTPHISHQGKAPDHTGVADNLSADDIIKKKQIQRGVAGCY